MENLYQNLLQTCPYLKICQNRSPGREFQRAKADEQDWLSRQVARSILLYVYETDGEIKSTVKQSDTTWVWEA